MNPGNEPIPTNPTDPMGPRVTKELLTATASDYAELVASQFAGMDNILTATREQSLRATEAASLGVKILTDAVICDPRALGAINGHNGPIARIANAASRTHQHQTGHSLEGGYYFMDGGQEKVLKLLGVVDEKVNDHRWDGTTHAGLQVDATAAHARKDIAIASAQALVEMSRARGAVRLSQETAELIEKTLGDSLGIVLHSEDVTVEHPVE